MDIELEKLAAKWGGRLMHTESQHEVISFRPDGFAGFAKEVQRIEREACAKVCEGTMDEAVLGGNDDYNTGREMGAWVPIETAPKDGTRILVGGKSPNGNRGYDAVGQAYWRREIKYAEDSPRCDEPEGFYWASDNTRSGQCAWYVTHWMPLPEAPNV